MNECRSPVTQDFEVQTDTVIHVVSFGAQRVATRAWPIAISYISLRRINNNGNNNNNQRHYNSQHLLARANYLIVYETFFQLKIHNISSILPLPIRNSTFQLFDSGFGHKDLIFSDDTESLSRIPWENQTYERWLGPRFLRLVENLESVSRIHEAGIYAAAHHIRGEVVLLCIPIHITWSYLFDAWTSTFFYTNFSSPDRSREAHLIHRN